MNFRHGHAVGVRPTAEYRTWVGMKTRCLNSSTASYRDYGARGITVASQWVESFAVFLADVGPKPSPAHTLERIYNDGNYEPGNVRWATRKEQAANRRWRGNTLEAAVEHNHFAKLTWDEARQIRASRDVPAKELAIQYNVGKGAIWCIWRGSTWREES